MQCGNLDKIPEQKNGTSKFAREKKKNNNMGFS